MTIKVYNHFKERIISMRLPNKITPCPILESIVEVRFDSNVPPDAIFGIIYKQFETELPTVKKLPILQLPEQIRSLEPALQFKPYYQIYDDNFIMQIGPRTVSLINKPQELGDYIGWEGAFSGRLKKSFKRINDLGIFSKITRLGIRYINFFPFNIFDKINLTVNMNDSLLQNKETTFRTVIQAGNFYNALLINNDAEIIEPDAIRRGSVIDIDTTTNSQQEIKMARLDDFLEEGHLEEKTLFFSLFKPDYLKTLNPIY